MSEQTITGGCLCGAIRYEISTRPGGAVVCHCRRCQRLSGSAFATGTLYPREHFQMTQGEPLWYQSSQLLSRGFCGKCGSQLFALTKFPGTEDSISVSIGSHDDPNLVPVAIHTGVESQQAWLKLDDGLPRHELSDSFVEDTISGNDSRYKDLLPDTLK